MFVSSYSTYIDTSVTKKIQNDRAIEKVKPSESFASKLLKTTQKDVTLGTKLPINYISNYKALGNRQRLEQSEERQINAKSTFSKLSAMSNSKVSYEVNSKMFSFMLKPKGTIDQTPKLDRNLPVKAQKRQEALMKTTMVNTYVANENYYRITAA